MTLRRLSRPVKIYTRWYKSIGVRSNICEYGYWPRPPMIGLMTDSRLANLKCPMAVGRRSFLEIGDGRLRP